MEQPRLMWIALIIAMTMMVFPYNCLATVFTVGDIQPWDLDVNYTNWASGKTFYVGDKLVFKYTAGVHELLEVSKSAYESCDTSKPMRRYMGTINTISMDSAGDKYYICGIPYHCSSGIKLAINVNAAAAVAVHPSSSPSPSSSSLNVPSPSPARSPSSASPIPPPRTTTVGSPSPADSPMTYSPAAAASPTSSPSPSSRSSPNGNVPSPSPAWSPSSVTATPTPITSTVGSPSPASFPTTSPAASRNRRVSPVSVSRRGTNEDIDTNAGAPSYRIDGVVVLVAFLVLGPSIVHSLFWL